MTPIVMKGPFKKDGDKWKLCTDLETVTDFLAYMFTDVHGDSDYEVLYGGCFQYEDGHTDDWVVADHEVPVWWALVNRYFDTLEDDRTPYPDWVMEYLKQWFQTVPSFLLPYVCEQLEVDLMPNGTVVDLVAAEAASKN